MATKKKKPALPTLCVALTGEGSPLQRYYAGLRMHAIGGMTNPTADATFVGYPYLAFGTRSLRLPDDAIEVYACSEGIRHSLCIIEFQANQGYKAIFHVISKILLPEGVYDTLPMLLTGVVLNSLFPGYEFFYQDKIMCLRTPTTWVPTKLCGKSAQHLVLLNALDVFDNPSIAPLVGAAPSLVARWNTRLLPLPEPPESTEMVSPLSKRVPSRVEGSMEAAFNPDVEVSSVEEHEL